MKQITWLVLLVAVSATAADTDRRKIELGFTMTQVYLPVSPVGSVHYQPGVGFLAGYTLTKHVALDGSWSVTPTVPFFGSSYAGGHMRLGVVGIRAGLQKGKLGLFAKARPGFVSFDDVLLREGPAPDFVPTYGTIVQPAFDFGGVVLLSISKRFFGRYEIGDLVINHRRREWPGHVVAGATANNLTFAIGFGVRF